MNEQEGFSNPEIDQAIQQIKKPRRKPEDKPAPPPKSVADYIAGQIHLSGRSQKDLSDEIGFGRPNMLTMIKRNDCKLPMSKVGVIAKALNIDALFLFKLCMAEYEPQTWAMIQSMVLKQPLVTQNEMEIINLIRSKAKVQNPRLRTAEEECRLLDVINELHTDNAVRGD